jgi:CBS domain-containing protein
MAFAVGSALLHNDVIGLDDRSTEFAQFFSRYNLTLALLNLLPFPPFNAPIHAAERTGSSRKSERIARCDWRAGIVCSVVLLIVGVAVTDPIALTAACAVGTATVRAAARSRTTALLGATVAAEVMTKIGDIPSLPHGATVRAIIPEVLRSQHGVFRVCHGERTLGFTFREDLIEGAISGDDMYVSELLDRELTTVASTLPLEEILDVVMAGYNDPLLVADGEAVVGLLFREQLVEFVLVQNAAGSPAAAAERD